MSPLYEAVYRSQPDEHAHRVTKIEGTIPKDLDGTFLRNGPGLMQVGEDAMSFFDAHALIAGVSFQNGQATFRSRFVRTPLFEKETAAKRIVKRRIFTNHPSRWSNLFALDFGNGAMHDVYAWGKGDGRRVVAGNDPGHFALDPKTLETKGPETWKGAVTKGFDTSPMPYRDPHEGRLVGWIKKQGGPRPDAIRFVELDDSFAVVKETKSFPLGASPVLVHDQRATKTWHVAIELPYRLSIGKALWGAVTPYEAFSLPEGATATLLLARRDGSGDLLRIPLPAPARVAFHIVNAYDDGDRVVVDTITYDGSINFTAAGPEAYRKRTGGVPGGPSPAPMRYVVDANEAKVVESKKLGDVAGEAPEVRDDVMGRKYRFAYFPISDGGSPPDRNTYFYFNAIAKVDVEAGTSERWVAPESTLVSPCGFVARPSSTDEDDGWVLTYLLREDGAHLAILDARALAKGPVATLDLDVTLPGVSHTRWAEGLHLDA